jgi:hypothetical protein
MLLDSWHAESGTLIRKLSVTGSPLEIQIPRVPGILIDGASEKLTLTPGQSTTLTYRWK